MRSSSPTIDTDVAPREALAIVMHHGVRDERAEDLALDAIEAIEKGRVDRSRAALAKLAHHISSGPNPGLWQHVVDSIARKIFPGR